MVKTPEKKENKEVDIEDNQQIELLKRNGWEVCGLKCDGNKTVVVFRK